MRNLFDYTINKEILAGHFPTEKLRPLHVYPEPDCDFKSIIRKGMGLLNKDPESIGALLPAFYEIMKSTENIGKQEAFQRKFNTLINAKCPYDAFNESSKTKQEAVELFPAVTELDKGLWYFANVSYLYYEFRFQEEIDQYAMMVTWCYLLREAQEKEYSSGLTLIIDAIDFSTPLLSLLLESPWTNENKKLFRPLTEQEKSQFEKIDTIRRRLFFETQEEKKKSKEIAAQTEVSWHRFVRILNELSERESSVVEQIIQKNNSAQEKLKTIKNYNTYLESFYDDTIAVGEDIVDLDHLFDDIELRYENALYYCRVSCGKTERMPLSLAAFGLVMEPTQSFNYLFILYHEFRLSINPNVAIRFFSLALEKLALNLDVQIEEKTAFDDILDSIHSILFSFIEQHKTVIDSLSFTKLQDASADLAPGISALLFSLGLFQDRWNAYLEDRKNSQEFIRDLEALFSGQRRLISEKELISLFTAEEQAIAKDQEKALARQVVVSLNIIYLINDALRLVLDNKQLHCLSKDIRKVQQYEEMLCDLDAVLIHSAYSHLDETEIGMRAFRRTTGIDARSLSDQERQNAEKEAEKLSKQNIALATNINILKSSIESIVEGIENDDIKHIMDKAKEIRKKVFSFPNDADYQLVMFLDEKFSLLSRTISDRCKKEYNEFFSVQSSIKDKLGTKCYNLPTSAIDSLTTAELLYEKYVDPNYAERGFDYSSISVLYYQAFENAYNNLIWSNYACFINAKIDDGYTKKAILGRYLPKVSDIEYFKGKYAQQHCTYRSFERLLEEVKSESHFPEFCDMLANHCGFGNREEMLNDCSFMQHFHKFLQCFSKAKDNRNNASHGGSCITFEQCKSDKKTVLNELERVRSDSIGLIQQLLYLLYKE